MEKSKFTPIFISRLVTRLFASVIIVISIIVLIGWYRNLMFLTRFSINEVPMVPSTAFIFITLAAGLWFYVRQQKIPINRYLAIYFTLIVVCLSCFLFITNLFNFYPNWELAFIKISETELSTQIGHMSPVTALLFIISGIALLFLLSNKKIIKTFSIILTLLIFSISLILLLAYGFGIPFFYFDNFIPPAVLTVLSFFAVSVALVAASYKNTLFVKTIWKTNTSAKLLRVFLPTTIVITVIESLIIIRIFPLFNINPAIGVSLVILIFVGIVTSVIYLISKNLGKTLDSVLLDLSESEEKFRFVFENSPVGKSITGIDGALHVNQSFCNMLGYSEKEIKAQTWNSLSHPDDIQKSNEVVQSLLNKKKSQVQFEKRYIHKNGTTIFTDVSTYLQCDSNGDPQFFITSVFDISERKQAEEKEKIHNANNDLLSKTAMQFVEFPQDSNIYDFVGEQVREFVGKDSYVVVNSIDKNTASSTIKSLQGVGKLGKIVSSKLGRNPVGMTVENEDINSHYKDGKLHIYKDGLYGILVKTVPKSICRSLEKLAGVNQIFVIDLVNKERFFGNVIIFLKEKTVNINNKQLIEAFIKQASIAILKKEAEEQLRINEEKLNIIINSSPIGICTVDMKGNFVTSNSAYEIMVGYSKEELKELSFFDVTHPNDRPKNKKLFQNMFSLETTGFSMEKRYIRKDGKEITVSVNAIGNRDAEGNVKFGIAFIDDISQRKLSEQAISLSHNRYRDLFNESPIPLWEEDFSDIASYLLEVNKNGNRDLRSYFDNNPDELIKCAGMLKIIDVNQAALDLYKAENKEQLIENISSTFTENSFSIFKEELISIVDGKKIYETEAEIKTLRGELKQIYLTLKIDYSHQPDKFKALLATSDISKLKLAEKALLQNQKRYKNAQAMGKVGNWEYDLYTTKFWASDEAKNIYGLDKNSNSFTTEKVENCLLDRERERVHQALVDLIDHNKEYDLVFDIITFDKGIRKTIHSIGEIERDINGKPLIISGVVSDITAMMQIQKTIVAKNKEMENYLYVASHDLRTPLVNIQGFSQRLQTQADSIKKLVDDKKIDPEILKQLADITDENIPKTLDFIFTNIEKMDTLINGLLKISRTGRMEMNIKKNDMNVLFAKILNRFDFQINEISCKVNVNNLPVCYGDGELLDQLFTNIINNALKYYDEERPLVITVDAKSIFNKVVYTISDTGKGIANKHLDKIWDVFYRVDPKSGKAGEGIGLSLVKQIVEKHKGKIWVESEINIGSVFHIELNNSKFTEF